jgi:hypothetical protein
MGWLSPLSPALVREERLASLAYGQAPHEIAAQLVARGSALFKGPKRQPDRAFARALWHT